MQFPTPPRLTGIFGGSFNPLHCGHIALAREVVRQQLAADVWLMVSPQNPLKQQADLADEEWRLTMARRALEDVEHVEASDFEFQLPRPSYTWHTLQALKAAYPQRTFALIIGSDNWLLFDRWAHADDLRANYPIIIYPRKGFDVDTSLLPKSVQLLQAPLFPITSTDIRQLVKEGKDIDGLVPESIRADVRRMYKQSFDNQA